MAKIKNMGTATMRFGEGVIVSGSAGIDTHSLVVTGSTSILGDITCNNISIGADAAGTGRTISSGNTDTSIRFNASDGIDLVVGGVFMVSCDENASQDSVVINEGSNDVDFRIESNSNTHQLFTDAADDYILINSNTATPSGLGSDTNVFVSGSKDGKGQSVFGGNVVISGSLTANGLSFPTTDGSANQVIKTDGNGVLSFVNQSGGGGGGSVSGVTNGANNRIATFSSSDTLNGEANLNFDGSVLTVTGALGVYANISDYAAIIDNDQGTSGHGLKVTSDGTGSGTNLFDVESASTTVLRVRGDGRVGIGKVTSLPAATLTVSSSNTDSDLAIAHKIHHIGDSDTSISFDADEISFEAGGRSMIKMSEGSIDQVLIMSGGAGTSPNVKNATDTNFFVSGSIGSRGSSTAGTAVFGGDLVVSGNARLHGNIIISGDGDGTDSIFFDGTGLANGPWIKGNTQVLTIDGDNRIDLRFDEQVKFAGADGNNELVQVFTPTASSVIEPQLDAIQIFSGAIGSRGTTTRGTSVFTGDVVISGSLTANITPKVLMVHMSSDFAYSPTGTNEFQAIPFNNVLKDTFGSGEFDTGTYTFTASEEGFYNINVSAYQQSINTGTSQYQLWVSSSCSYAQNNGGIAFRNYFPGGSAENSAHMHKLDRVAHLEKNDKVKINFRNIGGAESGTTINSGLHLTYLTINKL